MAWDDAPPTQVELKSAAQTKAPDWASTPPTKEELSKHEQSTLSKIGQSALEGVAAAGNWVNKYTGAPSRAAVGAAQEGNNPITAFANQFGEDPSKAPTGRDIAIRAGVPDTHAPGVTAQQQADFDKMHNPAVYADRSKPGSQNPYTDQTNASPADVAGFGIDFGADWTNLLPLSAAIRGIVKGGAKVAIPAAEGVGNVVKNVGKTVIEAAPGGKSVTAAAEGTADAVKNILNQTLNPRYADDFPKLADIAKKNGIDLESLPESVKFGDKSIPARIERSIREGAAGQQEIDRWNKVHEQMNTAINSKIKEIGGGEPVDLITAGDTIREGYNQAVERLFSVVDQTHNKIIEAFPGLRVDDQSMAKIQSKLDGMRKWATGELDRGITATDREQAKQVLQAVNAFENTNGSYKQTYEALSKIGRYAFKEVKGGASDIPVDIKKFQDLYFTVRDNMIDSLRFQKGDKIADALKEGNALISDFNKDAAFVKNVLQDSKIAPENVFRRLILNGDSNKIAALKGMLTEEQLAQMKGAFLDSLARRRPDDSLRSYGELYQALQNPGKRAVVATLFKPDEVKELGELLHLGDRFGSFSLSTADTSGGISFRELGKSIKSGMFNRSVLNKMNEQAAEAAAGGSKAAAPSTGAILPERTGIEKAAKGVQTVQAGSEAVMKGPEKWADKGQQNLLAHGQDAAAVLRQNADFLSTAKGKQLLIQASDLKPGSKAMEAILNQIRSKGVKK